jgi:hypothetical protein
MERSCDVCGATYTAQRRTSRFCGGTCRMRALRGNEPRKPKAPKPAPKPAPVAVDEPDHRWGRRSDVQDATRAELEAAGRLDSAAGRKALALADLIDNPPPLTWSSIAGWSREHGAAMAAALAGAEVATTRSTLDEIRARRDAKRHA